jgi:hypothetical protein
VSPEARPPYRAALLLGSLAFILYGLTSPPGITWRHSGEDGAEFAAVGRSFGVTHPTGYPLFTLLLRIASIGADETAWRATLLSNIAGAAGIVLATLLFWEIGRRVVAERSGPAGTSRLPVLGATVAAAALAVSPLWWSQSIIVEVYALHLLFVTLGLWLALRFSGRPRLFWFLAYLAGLALTHHLQFVLVGPSLLILVLASGVAAAERQPHEQRPGFLAYVVPAAVLFFIPLTLYAVLYFRSRLDPVLDWGDPENWEQLWWVIRGEQYRFRMFTSKPAEVVERLTMFFNTRFPEQFGWTVIPMGFAGVVALWMRARAVLVALGLYAVLQIVFTVNYAIPDPEAYYLPVSLVWGAFVAAGVTRLGALLASAGAARGRVLPAAIGLGLLVLSGPLATLPARWRNISLAGDTAAEDYSRTVIGTVPPGSLILSDGDGRTFALWYRQSVTERTDVTDVYRSLLVWPWYRENVARRDSTFRLSVHDRPMVETSRHVIVENMDHRPVYTTFVDRWVAKNYRSRPENGIFRVVGLRRPFRAPDGPVLWKAIDLSAAANADFRLDPFTPGSPDSSGLFPGLGGGAIYWGTLPLMMERPQSDTGRPSVFTTARQTRAEARFPLAPEPTVQVVLLVDGGAIGRLGLRLGEARVDYASGPADTVEIRSYENVWDFAAESYEIEIPEDVGAWHGPHNQSLTVIPIATDPLRTPVSLTLTGEGPPGETGEAAGYTVFAATQVLARGGVVQGE